MPDVAAACFLKETWDALTAFAISRSVPFHDAQDLVSESLTKALDTLDPERGELLPYARTILINRIRNFRRDNGRRPEFPIGPGDEGIDPTSPLAIILHEERVAMNKQLIKTISDALTEEEAAFLVALGETIEEIGDRAVSETARRLGLAEQEGWNTFRRIQRKAYKARATQLESTRIYAASLDADAMEWRPTQRAQIARKEPEDVACSEDFEGMPPWDVPLWRLAYETARDKAFTCFVDSLTGDQLARLETLAS